MAPKPIQALDTAGFHWSEMHALEPKKDARSGPLTCGLPCLDKRCIGRNNETCLCEGRAECYCWDLLFTIDVTCLVLIYSFKLPLFSPSFVSVKRSLAPSFSFSCSFFSLFRALVAFLSPLSPFFFLFLHSCSAFAFFSSSPLLKWRELYIDCPPLLRANLNTSILPILIRPFASVFFRWTHQVVRSFLFIVFLAFSTSSRLKI